jgi:hypothetical protein
VDYYGISGRENIWLRFEAHCKKRDFSSETHGMLVFKKFTWENVDRSVFSTPEFAALAYEMELSKFRGIFNVGTSLCGPGSSSHSLNKELADKLDSEEHDEEVFNRLIEVLRNPVFVEDLNVSDENDTALDKPQLPKIPRLEKLPQCEGMWACQTIGAPFTSNPAKIFGQQNRYLALWYDVGKVSF